MSLSKNIKSNVPNTATVGTDGEYTLGVFYTSLDQTYHVCRYIPYARPPREALCGLHRKYWSACDPSKDSSRRVFCKACDETKVGGP